MDQKKRAEKDGELCVWCESGSRASSNVGQPRVLGTRYKGKGVILAKNERMAETGM